MFRTIVRFTSGAGLTLSLGLAVVPLGCESGGGMGMPTRHVGDEGPTIPEETVEGLRACATNSTTRRSLVSTRSWRRTAIAIMNNGWLEASPEIERAFSSMWAGMGRRSRLAKSGETSDSKTLGIDGFMAP
jgi:hypothetical protein